MTLIIRTDLNIRGKISDDEFDFKTIKDDWIAWLAEFQLV